jgi:hypothetical protein
MWTPRKLIKNQPIDFFARRTHFIDHMALTWMALPPRMRGKFYIPDLLRNYAVKRGIHPDTLELLRCKSDKPTSCAEPPFSRRVVVTSAYGDLAIVARYNERPLILMEHGVGLTFNKKDGTTADGYGGGEGLRSCVSLFLAPNEYIAKKTHITFPDAAQVIIGTPKLDPWAEDFTNRKKKRPEDPVVCISFHWDGSAVAPEAGNAFEYYRKSLPTLANKYIVIGHGHPKVLDKLIPYYQRAGIEIVKDFRDVMERADVYINDASSTLYEFCVTGKPVVVLNAPWFRRNVYHGLRFWDYCDPGPECNSPAELIDCIEEALSDPIQQRMKRRKYVNILYPHLGEATRVAARAIRDFCWDPE